MATLALAFASTLLISACGSGSSYKNKDRPPAPINVSVSIASKGISVSPTHFGGGPIVLIATNQSSKSQNLTIESDQLSGSKPGITQETGPINPRDTAQLKVNLNEGSYRVHVGDPGVKAATVTVGPQRQTAQQKVLQP